MISGLRLKTGVYLFVFHGAILSLTAQTQDGLYHIWQKSLPFISNYTTDEYKAALQNWCVEQDSEGIIYTGNNSGLLAFDGSQWQLIKSPGENPVRSLCKDSKGKIYFGGINEIGFLETDHNKGVRLHSITNHLDKEVRNFGDVWFNYCINDVVYFICDNHIFRWANNKFTTWKGNYGFAWKVNNQLYVDVRGAGLMRVDEEGPRLVPGGAAFKGKAMMALLPFHDNKFLAIGLDKIVSVFDEEGLRPLQKQGRPLTLPDAVYHAAKLSNGDYALATTGSGFYIMDAAGSIKINISRKSGITSDAVYAVYEDAEGDVWLATDNGISRIELQSPLRVLNDKHGLDENMFDVEYFNNTLYFSTSKGLFRLSESKVTTGPAFTLEKISGLDNLTGDCHAVGDKLIISNYDGIFILDENGKKDILYQGHTTWLESPSLPDQKHLLFETMGEGIGELIHDGKKWILGKPRIQISGIAYGAVRSSEGNILINTMRNGVYEVDWKEPDKNNTLANSYTLIHYDTTRGLSSMKVKAIGKAGTNVFASTDKGFHKYNSSNHTFTRAPGIMRHLRAYKGSWVNEIEPAQGDDFWLTVYHDFQSHVFKHHEGLKELPASGRFSNMLVSKIFDSQSGIVLFGSNKSLVLYNQDKPSDFRNFYKTILRKITVEKDSVIFPGGNNGEDTRSFPFEQNDLTFQFALPSYDHSLQNQFQYQLEGFDRSWSPWSAKSLVSFSNLPEGDYVFHVRGKNVYGIIGEEAQYAFSIHPPWYRTWWAYVIYIISFGGIIFLVVQWRSAELKRDKIHLENIIKERTEKISQQAEQLKEIDHLKSSFFANISHEFRTPLTLILAPLENELKKKSSPEGKESLLLIRRSAMRLLELVNQLLDLSKLEAGKMGLHIRQGDLNKFLSVIAAAFDSYADNKQVVFRKEIELTNDSYWFDQDKLEKIVTNLLSNAFKYTPAGGVVTFKVDTQDETRIMIVITDNGSGIPENEQSSLFSPFYQTRNAASGTQPGTGLGLSLVKELVKLYKGVISFESDADKGTKFSVALPVNRQAFDADQIIEGGPDDFVIHGKINHHALSDEVILSSEVDSNAEGRNTILVVEDNNDMRQFVSTILQKKDYIVLTASNGEEGLQLALKFVPSLILSDLMMPVMDGITLTHKLRKDERTSHIPVILLTAKNEQQSKLQGLQRGADDYLTKPFSPDELLVRIQNLIDQRKKLANKFRERIFISATGENGLSLDDKFLQRMHSLVETNLADYTFSVERMAEEMNLSRTQLLRKVKALTGTSPSDFIRDYRLKRAADMIRQKADTITQIGYAVGFNDQSYFTKCFKKQFGVTPSEFASKPEQNISGQQT